MSNAAAATAPTEIFFALASRAQDSRERLLDKGELEALYSHACNGFAWGVMSEAFAAVEGLLCQAERGNVCPDTLPRPSRCEGMSGYTAGQIQALEDRVEALNHLVLRGAR